MTRTPRTWLFVPGHQERKIERAGRSGSDAVILDLEDGVPVSEKETARRLVGERLHAGADCPERTWVRIGAPADGPAWEADIEAVAGARYAGIVVPKVRGPHDLDTVETRLTTLLGVDARPPLVPIVTEQPTAVIQMQASLQRAGLAAAFWGSEDLSAGLEATRVKDDDGDMLDVFKVVQALFLIAARAAGVAPVDTPFLDLRDAGGLEREARRARWMGFAGKQVIHPDHVPVVQAAFTPNSEEVQEAEELLAAFGQSGGGALRVRDGMVDPPHLKRAHALLRRQEGSR